MAMDMTSYLPADIQSVSKFAPSEYKESAKNGTAAVTESAEALQEDAEDSIKLMKRFCYAYIVLASVAILIFGLVISKMCMYIGGDDTAEELAMVSTAFSLLVTYFFLFFASITGGLWYLTVELDDDSGVLEGILVTFVSVMIFNLVLLIWWRSPYAASASWKATYEEVY